MHTLNTSHRLHSRLCSNSKSPGEIDNTRLLESDTNPKANIKEGLQEGQDYELVHESIWQLLFGWYGGGPCVTRSVISEVRLSLSFRPVLKSQGENYKRVEVYPLMLKLLHTNKVRSPLHQKLWLTYVKDGLPAPASEYTLTISKTATLDAVKKAVRFPLLTCVITVLLNRVRDVLSSNLMRPRSGSGTCSWPPPSS